MIEDGDHDESLLIRIKRHVLKQKDMDSISINARSLLKETPHILTTDLWIKLCEPKVANDS